MSPQYKVEVLPYDPEWALHFQELKAKLMEVLEGEAVRIEHVGSTSVPGLDAKPVLDVDVVIPKEADFERVKDLLAEAGYQHRGDLGVQGREAFRAPLPFEPMRHNLYVLCEGADELKRHLGFRDWLRSHDDDREAYAQAKRATAQAHAEDIEAYIDAKSEVILAIYKKAGLFDPSDLPEVARTVLINRYGLQLQQLEFIDELEGLQKFKVTARQGEFWLLACPRSGSTTEDSTNLEREIVEEWLPIKTAGGARIAKEPFFSFALFVSRAKALDFLVQGGFDESCR